MKKKKAKKRPTYKQSKKQSVKKVLLLNVMMPHLRPMQGVNYICGGF